MKSAPDDAVSTGGTGSFFMSGGNVHANGGGGVGGGKVALSICFFVHLSCVGSWSSPFSDVFQSHCRFIF